MRNPAALKAALSGDLANFMAASMPGGIERQEAEGQAAFVASSQLPKEIHGATREQLEAIGFKFGNDADELFVECKLPPGWKLKATEHSMHNEVLDDKGRKRAGIFYKAAFYDRRADMNMSPRYRVESYDDGSAPNRSPVRAKDQDTVLREFGEYERGGTEGYEAGRKLRAQAEEWLTAQFPQWRDPLAHWD